MNTASDDHSSRDTSLTIMSTSEEGLPLPVLFDRALQSASRAYDLPITQEETQSLVQAAVKDLLKVSSGIEALSLFSTNESVDDLATGDLIYLLVPYVLSEMNNRMRVQDEEERKIRIVESQVMIYLGNTARLPLNILEASPTLYNKPGRLWNCNR